VARSGERGWQLVLARGGGWMPRVCVRYMGGAERFRRRFVVLGFRKVRGRGRGRDDGSEVEEVRAGWRLYGEAWPRHADIRAWWPVPLSRAWWPLTNDSLVSVRRGNRASRPRLFLKFHARRRTVTQKGETRFGPRRHLDSNPESGMSPG
jgi:hypothetical protein